MIQSLSAFDQIRCLWSSCVAMVTSLTESTDAVFRRVHIMKKDEHGNIKYYNKQDADGVKKECHLTYIEDMRTGRLYLDEPGIVTSCKCALIALSLPLHAAVLMSAQTIKTVYSLFMKAIKTCREVFNEVNHSPLQAVKQLGHGLIDIGKTLSRRIYEIVKIPLFTLCCTFAAVYGFFKPYHARVIEADIEYAWQQGMSYREDFRRMELDPGQGCCPELEEGKGSACYLAYCFQPRANISDPDIIVLKTEKI